MGPWTRIILASCLLSRLTLLRGWDPEEEKEEEGGEIAAPFQTWLELAAPCPCLDCEKGQKQEPSQIPSASPPQGEAVQPSP